MQNLTIEQFGQEIKKKYPQYQNMADAEVGNAVLKQYPQYQSRIATTPTQSTAQPTEQKKNNFLSQIFKPVGRTIATGLAAGEAGLDLLKGDTAGAQEALTRERKTGLGVWRPVGIDEQGQEKSFGGQVKDIVGTGAGVASFMAPGSIGGTGIKGLVKAGTVTGALGSGSEALQNNKSLSQVALQTAGGTLLGGALGGAIPMAGKMAGTVTRPFMRGAGNIGAEILGRTTGAGAEAIKQVFSNPNVIKFARKAGKEGPENMMTEALSEAKRGLERIFSGNSKAYRSAMSKIKASPQDLTGAVDDIRNDIVNEAIEGFGIRFVDGKKLNNLDFNASDIVEGTASVQRAFDRMFGEPISSVADLDRLKRSLGRIANGAPMRSPAQALIYKMKDSANRVLKEKIPGYAEEMSRFGDIQDLADEIQKVLSLGDKASTDTTIRKLMSTMRQNNELRKQMLESLGQKEGKDILGKIAGITLSSRTPRGLAGTLQPTATTLGGASAIINPSTIPALLLYLASSSPRLVAEAVNILGKSKTGLTNPQTQRALRNLIIQASNEINDGTAPLNGQVTSGIQKGL